MLWAADWSEQDRQAVHEAVHRTAQASRDTGAKGYFKSIDADHVYQQLANGGVPAVISGGYAMAFDAGSPWYSKTDVFLEELLVLRLRDRPGHFRQVVDTFEQLARNAGCIGVCVGTGLNLDGRLARVYQRFGYQAESQALFRRIT